MKQTPTAPTESAYPPAARRVRVLYLSDSYYLGADTRCELSLLEYLDLDQFSVTAVTLPHGPTAQAVKDFCAFEHHPIDLGTMRSPVTSHVGTSLRSSATFTAGLAHVAQVTHRTRPDVVVTGDRTRSILAAKMATRISGAALVYHPGSAYSASFKNARWKRQIACQADLVVANSNFTRDSYLQVGVAPERAITAYNGLNATYYTPGSGADVLERYSIPQDALLVGMFSLPRPFKGHQLLLKAMARVHDALPQAHLILLGDGPEEDDLRALAGELELVPHVTFAEFQHDTRPFYRALDLYILASDEESFGLVTIEAMACERAVVGTASGGTPEIIVDQETGLLVPPRQVVPLADAIIELLRDPARRHRMGQNGRQRVLEQFTVERRAQQVAPLLAKVAQMRAAAG